MSYTINGKRLQELVESEITLSSLYEAGVENWEGYEEALPRDIEEEISQIMKDFEDAQ